MPYTDYLKSRLESIIALTARMAAIEAEAERLAFSRYAFEAGAFKAMVEGAVRDAKSALDWLTEHVVPAERDAERLASLFEDIGIDLDSDALYALERLGKREWTDRPNGSRIETSPYRSDRIQLANAFSSIIRQVQEGEREREHDTAHDALLAAGFVYDEDSDSFLDRAGNRATITLTNGRECRYEWRFESASGDVDSGKSGEFHRLLALIQPNAQAVEATQ